MFIAYFVVIIKGMIMCFLGLEKLGYGERKQAAGIVPNPLVEKIRNAGLQVILLSTYEHGGKQHLRYLIALSDA